MKKNWIYLMSLSVALMLAACSSSEKSTDEPQSEDVPEMSDAGTDSVPQAAAEQPAAEPPSSTAAINPPTEAAPVASAPPAVPRGDLESYTVQSGQTLMQVAFEVYGDLYRWREIYEANRSAIADPNHVPAGTVLNYEKPSVPVQIDRNGEKYLIKSGDTLGSISGDVYGTRTKWRALWENNRQLIRDPNKIFAGFYLYYEKELANPAMAKAQPAADSGAPDRVPAGVVDGAAGTPPSVN